MQTALIPGTKAPYLTQPLTENEIRDMQQKEYSVSGTIRISQKEFETEDNTALCALLSRRLIGSEKLQDLSYRIVTEQMDYLYLEVFGVVEPEAA